MGEEGKPGFAGKAAAAGRELLEKVREYVEVGAAEASRITATAKLKVDLETARFRRAGLYKDLGKRYYSAWERKRTDPLPGTEPLLREIRDIEEEMKELARRIADFAGQEETGTPGGGRDEKTARPEGKGGDRGTG